MRNTTSRNIVFRFAGLGFLIGLAFPIIVIAIELITNGIAFNLPNFAKLHIDHPAFFLISISPFIIAIASYYLGKNFADKTSQVQASAEEEIQKAEKILNFTQDLSSGNINAEYHLSDENDSIGGSLIKLRDYLKQNKEEEDLRRKEDQQRNWATEGLAKFAEILRQNNDDLNELSYNIISNLVNYVDAKQGGFFILNDNNENDKHFELSACYAYSRKKFMEKRIEWGEGLVGACALEKETIFLLDIPGDHVRITSGLGEATPRCLLIIPLKLNDEVHGVIELASLEVFEPYQVDFMEKLAESIASTISSVKINLRTARLLRESQEQASKLSIAEEDMRRNMEELELAKEEAAKQGELLTNFTNSVNHTLVRAEYNTDGILLYANTRFLNKLGYTSNAEVEGKHISIFIHEKDRDWFFPIWNELSKGGKHFEGDMKHITKQGKDFWSMATYTCVRTNNGSIEKILFLGIDITEQKKINLDFEGQIAALNLSTIKAEFAPDGTITDGNKLFMDISGIQVKDFENKDVFSLVDPSVLHIFKKNWQLIHEGTPYEYEFSLKSGIDEYHYIQGFFTAVKDMYGEVSKIIYLGSDVTDRKRIEIENQIQNEQLRQQEDQLIKQQEEIKHQHEEFKIQTEKIIKEIEAVKLRNELTLEGAMDAIVTINQDEKVEFFNKAAEALWGFSKSEVLGKHIRILLPPPHQNVVDGEVIRFLQSPQNYLLGTRTEVNILSQSGETIPVLLTLTGVHSNNIVTYTAFIQNISVELF